ncbi:putative short chain oxidoreductase/dehydrogenase [Xylogone sp. PMI_703]|nr:putative short chain oxidoreductase/dehydrogenase [Xylogone sp. PMI_703]
MAKQIWLVTGASSGFGAAIAETVLQRGHQVIATARHPNTARTKYPQIEAQGGKWITLDVNSKIADEEVNNAIKEFGGGRIDVVVNNAGYSLVGCLEDMSEEEIQDQINTNVYGPIRVIKGALPYMRSQKSGVIVNVTSIGGLDGRPACTLYAGSKFALEGISEALSRDLASFNIRVLIVEPGAFRTNFFRAHKLTAKELTADYKGTVLDHTLSAFTNMHGKQAGDPAKAAARIFDFVTGTGLGEGKTGLLRLPLGPDCWKRANDKVESLRENLDMAKEAAFSTDFDE